MNRKEFKTSSGTIIYWINEIRSDRQTLVFLPGLSATHILFDKQLEYFEDKYNCLVWDAPGHGGILSLGQGIFFGIGGYCMAMFLKLEASDMQSTAAQTTPGIPDFMDWNQITSLPGFWEPFHSFGFTLFAIIIIPILLAFIIGFAMFTRRVGDVYFSIIMQAVVAILTILIIGQQGFTGGINGITDLKTLHGWDIRTDEAKYVLYYINALLLIAVIMISRFVLSSKLGRLLSAMRDKEERVRFSGYDVAMYKVFIFCFAAVVSSIGGAMFTLQVGFMSPTIIGIVPSIEMVILAAVGGRLSLIGAVYGAILVNLGKTYFSEAFPEVWLYFLGALFIGVVMFLPNGLAGLYEKYVRPLFLKKKPIDSTLPPPSTDPDKTIDPIVEGGVK